MRDTRAGQADRWPFVRNMLIEEEVESTNDRAAAFVREGRVELPFGAWAKRQTQGRGRGDRAWWSDEGSLTFTIALDPRRHGIGVADEPKLALATAVSAIEALNDLGFHDPTLGIRWPNDLEVHGRKFGGILPEILDVPGGRRVLVGIGINLGTDLARAPAEVRGMAVGLKEVGPACFGHTNGAQVLAAILGRFESALERLVGKDPELARQWAAWDLLRGRETRLDLGASIVVGRAEGIDADGALLIDDGRGVRRFWGGRVLRSKAGAP